MQLSQKEASLLKDMKDQEKLCIEKYSKHAACACDGQLKNLFTQLASAEKQHLGYLDKIGEGTVPQVATGSSSIPSSFSPCYGMADTPQKQSDCFLCSDLLAGEKHVSSLYDTSIFEFRDPAARKALNHIQAEEQQHGEKLYAYMSCNRMYS